MQTDAKKTYQRPTLSDLGDVAALTLGGSGSRPDGGNAGGNQGQGGGGQP
jgi:hypothetical protein